MNQNNNIPKIAPNGVILTIKPTGITSRKWDNLVQKKLGAEKSGHSGTLDPMATGLQIVLLGNATRLSQFIVESDKKYIAKIMLGIETDTWDSEGQVICEDVIDVEKIDKKIIIKNLESLKGTHLSYPPLYSSVKVDGKPLYYWTRKGIKKELPQRKNEIFSISLLNINLPYIEFEVHSSKGTYIRWIAHELGRLLGCGAHLTYLYRSEVGPFTYREAHDLDNILSHNIKSSQWLLSKLYPKIEIDENQASFIKNGRKIHIEKIPECKFFLISKEDELCAVAEPSNSEDYRLLKVFNN